MTAPDLLAALDALGIHATTRAPQPCPRHGLLGDCGHCQADIERVQEGRLFGDAASSDECDARAADEWARRDCQ